MLFFFILWLLPPETISTGVSSVCVCLDVFRPRFRIAAIPFGANNKSPGSISNIDGGEYHCNKTQVRKVISGVVGAASSVTSIQVANLLRLFRIPQVSHFIFSYLVKPALMLSFVIAAFYVTFLLILPF